MVAQQHYQRLKHLYADESAAPTTGPVEISYGFAKLAGVVEEHASTAVGTRVPPYQRLLGDAASLAASSVEKDEALAMNRFHLSVQRPDYRGPVRATAEIAFAEPPRYHVRAVLTDEAGDPIAEGLAVFAPSGEPLPPDPAPDKDDEMTSTAAPAPFMPVHVTRYGVLCLN